MSLSHKKDPVGAGLFHNLQFEEISQTEPPLREQSFLPLIDRKIYFSFKLN